MRENSFNFHFSLTLIAVLCRRISFSMLSYAILYLAIVLSVESCTDLFKYFRDSDGIYGQVIASDIQLEKMFRIEIHLSVAAVITGVN